MATRMGRNHGQPFKMLVGNFPYGSFPDQNLPAYQNPPPSRQAISHQVLTVGDRRTSAQNHIGRNLGTSAPKTAQLTVADDDFTTGVAVLTLGDYVLTSAIDYVVGGGVAVTATNLAAAINTLPGFEAAVLGAVVSVVYTLGPANSVDFFVTYYGTIVNFTPLVPDLGVMGNGTPSFGPVTLL